MKSQAEFFMDLALKEAAKAFKKSEIPVGAVVAKGDCLLSQAHNTREKNQSPLDHAELLAIKKASKKLNSWRLEGCQIYVSLEPCLMCIGAILQARFSDLFYSCSDPKAGFSSFYKLTQKKNWTHKINIYSGIRCRESSLLLKFFFKQLREEKKVPGL